MRSTERNWKLSRKRKVNNCNIESSLRGYWMTRWGTLKYSYLSACACVDIEVEVAVVGTNGKEGTLDLL